jgi:hypothetical protein
MTSGHKESKVQSYRRGGVPALVETLKRTLVLTAAAAPPPLLALLALDEALVSSSSSSVSISPVSSARGRERERERECVNKAGRQP